MKRSECCVSSLIRGGVRVLSVVAAVATGTSFGVVRTIELSSFDDATHTATLTIGPGEGKMADTKYLFAAYDNADRGINPTNWANVCYIRTIYAATTNETHVWTLPEEWHNDSGALRFFLVQPIGPRVQEGPYLQSHGIGTTANLNGGSHLVFIDTGIKPTTQTETILDVLVYHYNDSAPFGLVTGYYLFSNGDTGQTHSRFFDNVGTYSFKYNATGNDGVHQLRLGPSGTFIDGECLKTHTPQNASYNDNIWLFARNNPSQAGNLTTTDPVTLTNVITGCKMRHCQIYSAQIITNGVLARSFTPRKVNNVPMMWDSVTQTAFGNSAPGSVQQFGWGETHVTLTNGTSETCSAARIFTRQVSRMNVDSRLKKVTLTLGGDSKGCVLYAVRGQEDLGAASDPAAWDDLILIGKIPAGVATYEATLPAEWWRTGGYARFLLKGSAAYDWPLESLSSTGEGSYPNEGHNGPDDQGYQYIDTGIVPTKNTTTSVRINVPRNIDMASFGIGAVYYLFSTSANMNWCFSTSAGNAQNAGYASSAIPKTDGNDHTYTLGPGGALVDGTSYATFSHVTTLTSAKSISLFARRAGSTSNEFGKFGPCTMYWATIDEGNERVRDFIPVEKDGLGYMYDKVTGKLFGNVNTSYGTAANGGTPVPFVKGAPIVSLASSDVLAVSDRVALSRGMQIIFR